MSYQFKDVKTAAVEGFKKIDYIIFIVVLTISLMGLMMVYSSSWPHGISDFNDAGKYFRKQLTSFGIGMAGMVAAIFIPYRYFLRSRLVEIMFALAFMLNILVRFISEPINGAHRWITISGLGISFMPSDIMKLTTLMLFAKMISGEWYRAQRPLIRFISAACLMGAPVAVVLVFQSDLGTAGTLGIALFMMFFVAEASLILPIVMGAIGLSAGGAMVILEPYRRERLTTFLNPFKEMKDDSWQIIQSLYAIGSGGVFGVGLGQSKQKYYYLPFAYSDFIFAIFAEEFGFVGAVILIGLYLVFLIRGLRTAVLVQDRDMKLAAYGISVLIFVQTLVHIAVATSSMPATGITMPLFSYGGTSLIVTLIEIGLLLNISKMVPYKGGKKKLPIGLKKKKAAPQGGAGD